MNTETLLILLSVTACGGEPFNECKGCDSGTAGESQQVRDAGGAGEYSGTSGGNAGSSGGSDAASLPSPSVCLAGFSALSCAAICTQQNGSTGCGSVLECFRKNDCTPEECATSPGNTCYTTGLAATYADQAYKECCK